MERTMKAAVVRQFCTPLVRGSSRFPSILAEHRPAE
jgi:hypothetical protein